MKKILALVLCVLTVLSVLASCSAAPAKNYSPKITVSSSAADEFAVWLTNRLGDSLKDNVYLSLGGDAANGLDMTNFENDGYILQEHRHRRQDRRRSRRGCTQVRKRRRSRQVHPFRHHLSRGLPRRKAYSCWQRHFRIHGSRAGERSLPPQLHELGDERSVQRDGLPHRQSVRH